MGTPKLRPATPVAAMAMPPKLMVIRPAQTIRSLGAMLRAALYQGRRPERTAAYQVVRQNLETWLAQRRVGVVQALAGCGESCVLHVLFGGCCAISAC